MIAGGRGNLYHAFSGGNRSGHSTTNSPVGTPRLEPVRSSTTDSSGGGCGRSHRPVYRGESTACVDPPAGAKGPPAASPVCFRSRIRGCDTGFDRRLPGALEGRSNHDGTVVWAERRARRGCCFLLQLLSLHFCCKCCLCTSAKFEQASFAVVSSRGQTSLKLKRVCRVMRRSSARKAACENKA